MNSFEYEQKFDSFRNLGIKLGLIVPKVVYRIQVDNPDGSCEKRRSISRSWVRNSYNWMFSQLGAAKSRDSTFGDGLFSFKRINATVETPGYEGVVPNATSYGYTAVAGDDTEGIVVGIGTGAEDFDDHVLDDQAVHGNAPGELSHNACDYVKSWNGGTLEMTNTWTRIFNNNSGGTISIGEIGIYGTLAAQYNYYGNAYEYLVLRDKVDPAVDVIDTAQLTVVYDIILTYPE